MDYEPQISRCEDDGTQTPMVLVERAKWDTLRAKLAEVERALRWILRSDLCHIPIGLRQRAGEALATTAEE